MLSSRADAEVLLKSLGAPERLMMHLQLVGEAADQLLDGLQELSVACDAEFVRVGVAIHDAGKIMHPRELLHAGRAHEEAGQALLLAAGAPSALARCCVSHARYDDMPVSFEELLIALSDKLWKGKRVDALEQRIVEQVAQQRDEPVWSIFGDLDDLFEAIAEEGTKRLARSQQNAGPKMRDHGTQNAGPGSCG